MSMPIIEIPDNPVDRNQSVSDLIESVALMETGLSHIINAEGEKIQKVIRSDDPTAIVPIEDIINVNNSVEKMVNTVYKLEMILQSKLDIAKDLDEEDSPGPTPIESPGAIIATSGSVSLTTMNDGSPSDGAIITDTTEITSVNLNGNVETFNAPSLQSYPMPRNGVLTDFSVFLDLTNVTGANAKQVVAKIFIAEPDSTIYNAVNETIINLPAIPAGTTTDFRMNGSVHNLNVELAAGTKLAMIIYYSTTTGSTSLVGTVGGSINIL